MTPIHLIGEYYVADIPDPSNAIISGNVITWKKGEAQGRGLIVLPPGNWQLICTTKECTETIAAKIVEKDGAFFKCYAGNRSHISPLRSLFCLMDERKCDLNKILLIIKKVS